MADISQINVGGVDYNAKDSTARTNSNTALTQLAYQETGNTASQAYSVVGTPINWKGTLYYLKTAVASGTTWQVGTNLTAATNLGKLTSNIKTYVNSSGKLVFRDLTGADTVLPFSGTANLTLGSKETIDNSAGSHTVTVANDAYYILVYYSTSTTKYTTVTSGATIISKVPNPNETNNGNNYMLLKTTSTTLGYRNNDRLAYSDLQLIRIFTE